jgi:hypothetical protein
MFSLSCFGGGERGWKERKEDGKTRVDETGRSLARGGGGETKGKEMSFPLPWSMQISHQVSSSN